MIARRRLFGSLAAALLPWPVAARAPAEIAIGAIRWDAWQSPGSIPTRAVEYALSPPHYRDRLPFFAEAAPDGSIRIDGGRQEVMDREIALALRAGLGFWGFVAYPRESPMSRGLHLYLASTRRAGLRFCLVTEAVQWSGSAPVTDWHLELLGHPDYQRVRGGRPLYFLGFLTDRLVAERWGGIAGLRAAVDGFRARAVASGAGNPFLVVMGRAEPGARFARALGADALGAYALAGEDVAAPYSALAAHAEERWQAFAATGLPVVPTIMTGWDRRPRIERPVPWEAWQRPGAGLDRFYAPPSPEELVAHMQRGIAWIRAHPEVATAGAALVYAWNENDEGGWLVPTLPHDDRRIEALRGLLCAPASVAAGPGCD